jgi:hypothetical protein
MRKLKIGFALFAAFEIGELAHAAYARRKLKKYYENTLIPTLEMEFEKHRLRGYAQGAEDALDDRMCVDRAHAILHASDNQSN